MENRVLSIKNVSKIYGKDMVANADISLDFFGGEITALIGNNGAGKTTLLNQMIGSVLPSQGDIYMNGINLIENPSLARQWLSSMPQFQVPIKGVSISHGIESILRIRGFSKKDAQERREDIIEYLQISQWKNKPGESLSGGLQRLASFAMCVTSDAPVLVLDEPTNDVDPVRRGLMWKYLRKLAKQGRVVIIVSHNLLEVEKYADRVILMEEAQVKRDIRWDKAYSNSTKHLLTIYDLEKASVELLEKEYVSNYVESEAKLIVALDEKEVQQAMGLLINLLEAGRARSYDLRMASLLEEVEGMVEDD